jgi:hypothetical protein
MKVPVHKIQHFFATCVEEFENHSCLIWIELARVFCGRLLARMEPVKRVNQENVYYLTHRLLQPTYSGYGTHTSSQRLHVTDKQ